MWGGGEPWRTRRRVGIIPGEDAEWGKTPCGGGNRGGDDTEWRGMLVKLKFSRGKDTRKDNGKEHTNAYSSASTPLKPWGSTSPPDTYYYPSYPRPSFTSMYEDNHSDASSFSSRSEHKILVGIHNYCTVCVFRFERTDAKYKYTQPGHTGKHGSGTPPLIQQGRDLEGAFAQETEEEEG